MKVPEQQQHQRECYQSAEANIKKMQEIERNKQSIVSASEKKDVNDFS